MPPSPTAPPFAVSTLPPSGQAAFVLAVVLATAVGARVDVPMLPVPMTLQSLAVVLAGLLGGWRLGAVAMTAYLLAGALGLPVFAGGAAGLERLTGATAGYLWSFPAAAILASAMVRNRADAVRLFLAALAGHGVILATGTLWLGTSAGLEKAVTAGLVPFVPGAAAKSALATALVLALGRWRRDR